MKPHDVDHVTGRAPGDSRAGPWAGQPSMGTSAICTSPIGKSAIGKSPPRKSSTCRPLTRLVPLAMALVIAGCASMAPPYERPALPVAASYPGVPGDMNIAVGAGHAADIEWQRFFEDARLLRLIELALQHNRDLRVAVLNIERARAQYKIQRADQTPTVNAAAGLTRQPDQTGTQTSTYQVGLAVTSWEVDFFGRVRSLSNAALSRYLATEEGRKSAQISLLANVASLHLAVQADDELLELTRRTLATREESLGLAQLLYDNGVVSALDLRQAQSLVQGARVTLARLQRQRALDHNALVLLVGQGLTADLPPARTLAQTAFGPELPAGLPSDLVARRPDIRQAEQLLIGANANIGAARAAFYPRLTLTGSAGTVSDELSGLFSSGSFAWSLSPQLVLPIFDAGRNRAGLAVAEVDRDIAVAQYEQAVQAGFREVADALASRTTLGDQYQAQQAQAEAEAQRFELSDLRYRGGAASYLDLLDAQRSLFTAQQAAIEVRLAQLQNQVALYRALGGGWTDGGASAAAAALSTP
jgi:multidrug efflux system outer membrane protein